LKSADELFDKQGRAVLLYTPNSPTEGHWVCLQRKSDGIYFFDSYGDKPDSADDLNGQPAHLSELLRGSGMPIYYNTKPYQKMRGDIATCGRHCVSRLIYNKKSPEQYDRVVKAFKGEPDDFVSALIYSFISK
jgi:hypothetical protein